MAKAANVQWTTDDYNTGYDLVKGSIFEEARKVNEGLRKEPSNKKLLGAWEALINVMDAAALLDEYNELRK